VEFLMSVPLIFGSHGRVRDALWLWFYLWTYAKPSTTEWQPCFDSLPISDAQIAFNLDVSVETVRKWRSRLEKLGFIRTEVVRPRYRRYLLGKPGVPDQSLAATQVEGPVN
jgi:Helix-turn-helix domain